MNEIIVKQKDQRLILRERMRVKLLPMDQVSHLVCDCYLTTVYMISGESHTVARLLKLFELELSDYGFIRVNNNIMVNSKYIIEVHYKKRVLFLSNDLEVKISYRRLALVRQLIVKN